MAFTGLFSVSQTSDITSFSVTDGSSYASEGQGTFSTRHIYVYKIDGTLLASVNWPFTDGATKALTGILNTDYSLLVNVTWASLNPQPGSVYTASEVKTFLNYISQFLYEKVQDMAAAPNIVNDTGFYNSLRIVQAEKENAEQATIYADQFNAQASINRAFQLINNESFYF